MFIMFTTDHPYGKPILEIENNKNPVAADEEVTLTCKNNNIDALPEIYHYEFLNEEESQLQNTSDNTFVETFGTVNAEWIVHVCHQKLCWCK